jgi:iron complex outermembrane receptor protein
MNRIVLYLGCCLLPFSLLAQSHDSTSAADFSASGILQEVVVKAFEQNRKLTEVGAAIGIAGQQQLMRFSNTNILPALNIIPGVRMEERSPGSYRLNIRGSSIRSPFGVRDVKVYFNEIPLTDPGGNTYLNELGFYNFQSIEIIKGPSGSLYGAGIGGAMLIHSMPANWKQSVSLDFLAGSYGLNGVTANARFGDDAHQNNFTYTHQASDGYRVQTNMRRDVASMETLLKTSTRQTLHAYILYSDLYYQTPGALTLKEYQADPRQARPGTGTAPGAVQNKAAIYQKNFTAGFSNEYQICEDWQNTTTVYGAYTDFRNPGIRVYEARKEPHFGGRSIFQFKHIYPGAEVQLHFGAEVQKGFFNTKDYQNKKGNSDSLQTDDDINNWQYMVFAQADIRLHHGWVITAGASFNKSSVQFTRVSSPPPVVQTRTFENKIAPRLSILKKLGPGISLYASAARGFSPPTVSELLKSSGTLGANLQPADGIDYEVGIKGNFLLEKLYVDINAFFFNLSNTIVQRIDTNGVFYYVNAGATRQNGLETFVSYQWIDQPTQFVSQCKLWVSYTLYDFHYKDFKQVNTDYSGKLLPGMSPQFFVSGLDLSTRAGVYTNITFTYSDRMALNDANTDFAGSYALLGARLGYQHSFQGPKIKLGIYVGADNIFNTKYSLGNDINAAAGRYYNAAPTANYYGGIMVAHLFH